jgi:hypothetical protein
MSPTDPTTDLIAVTTQLLPELSQLIEKLEHSLLSPSIDLVVERLRSNHMFVRRPGEDPDDVVQRCRRLLAATKPGLDKVRSAGPDAVLEAEEESGLESIVNLARPAILIKDGHFERPPGMADDLWNPLEQSQDSIARVAQRTGRLDLTGNPTLPKAGTGFLVGEDVVMTNRHVANAFTTVGAGGGS